MSFSEIYMQLPLAQRYAYIKEVHKKIGKGYTETRNFLGISYNTVKKAVESQNVVGRIYKEKLENPHKIYIYTQTLQKPSITAQELVDLLKIVFDLKTSVSTVNRYRNKTTLKYRPPLRTVLVTDNAKQLRYNFTQKHINQNTNWTNVVFSDESSFQLGVHKKWIWVDKYNITSDMCSCDKKYYPKVMIWGAVGVNFKSDLIIFKGHVNSESYIEEIFINSNFIEKADEHWGLDNWIFQQDNAPSHTSKVTKASLSELAINVLDDWPPYSPDLNIIETVWAIMKARIEKKNPKSMDDLIAIIQEVWDGLTFQTINGLIDTIPERLRCVNSHPERSYYHSY